MDLYARLSGEAHQHISEARNKADLILLEAIAVVETGYNSEHGLMPSELARLFAASSNALGLEAAAAAIFTGEREKRYLSFEDYCVKHSSTALLLAEARLKAARIVGKAIVSELTAVAAGFELWKYVQESLSVLLEREFKLTELQGQILWAELKIDPGFEGVTKPASRIHSAPGERDPLSGSQWSSSRSKWLTGIQAGKYSDVDMDKTRKVAYNSIVKYRSGNAVRASTRRGICDALNALGISCEFSSVPE